MRSVGLNVLVGMAAAFAAGCQLLELGDKIDQATDADNDETITLTAPDIAAEGAFFAVRAIDACTESTNRCETDSIEYILRASSSR